MYRTKSGKITGVLNDWDLAKTRGSWDGTTDKGKRTGTLPFAALELVENLNKPYIRRYRHDLESFGWCIVYICLNFSYGENIEFLQKWHDLKSSADARGNFLRKTGRYPSRPGFEALFASVRVFIRWLMNDVVEVGQELDNSEIWEGVLKFLRDNFNKNL